MSRVRKTIVFDFGNVLIGLDFEKSFLAFEKILNVDWSDRKVPERISNAILLYDKGLISDENFIDYFKTFNPDAHYNDLVTAWNYLIGDMPEHRFDFLEDLKDDYDLAILSNINNLHLQCVHNYLDNNHNINNFEDRYFKSVFYSHQIGMRKPENDIYLHVQKELDCLPDHILFIDDMEQNINAAHKHGWKAALHLPADSIELKLSDYISQTRFD